MVSEGQELAERSWLHVSYEAEVKLQDWIPVASNLAGAELLPRLLRWLLKGSPNSPLGVGLGPPFLVT